MARKPLIKWFAAVGLCIGIGAASSSSNGAGWAYRSDFGGATWPQFVSSNDTVLVYETKLSPYRERLRFFSSDGELLAEVEPTQRGVRREYHFVLVDDLHVIHPVGDERRIELLPQTSAPSPVARAFLAWAQASGGIAHNTYLHASTNPYADLSCAIGADGSIAIWRTIGPPSFEASPPGSIALGDTSIHGIFCLDTANRRSVAVEGVDLGAGTPPWVRIYNGAAEPIADFPLVLGDIRYGMHGNYVGRAALSGITAARALDDADWTWVATRISHSDTSWRIERARLVGDWPGGFRIMRANDIILAPENDALSEVVAVPWPQGQTSIAYAPQPFTLRPRDFPGPHAISPSGRYMLWTDRRSSIQVTQIPQ